MKKTTQINKSIGLRIREERQKFDLSREEFAEIIGLSDYYVGQLERGERQMSLTVLIRIANCLHVSLDYLIFGETHYNANFVHDAGDTYDTYTVSKDTEIEELLKKCSPKELALIKKLIKTLLPYISEN
jgi:transcriptional regulator with XRE-family HTH domain